MWIFLYIKNLQIDIPPLAEQQKVAHHVRELFKFGNGIEKRLAAAGEKAEMLTQAILGKAFRGELVPTEAELARRDVRPYEPAFVLLKRIRKAREEARPRTNKTKKNEKWAKQTGKAEQSRKDGKNIPKGVPFPR